jgi:type IV secretory pathway TraG/TraD family ATPase VirD4
MEELGNAKWSRSKGVPRGWATGGQGFFFGHPVDASANTALGENFTFQPANGHLLTVAQPRSGKGTTLIINNLLCYRGSAVVTDPKGELAWITAPRRRQLGQQIRILDPWSDVNRRYGSRVGVIEEVSHFNPLSVLKVGSKDFIEQLAYLADALILTQSAKDPFWDDSARELVSGLMAYVVENPAFSDDASLMLMRKLLMRGNDEIARMIRRATEELPDSVAALKLRQFGKAGGDEESKTIPSIIQTARTQTAFLDSVELGRAMADSDFSFDDLREGGKPTTVYLVLPPEKLKTYGRWLRLMVSIAIATVQKGPLEGIEDVREEQATKEQEAIMAVARDTQLKQQLSDFEEQLSDLAAGKINWESMPGPRLEPLKELPPELREPIVDYERKAGSNGLGFDSKTFLVDLNRFLATSHPEGPKSTPNSVRPEIKGVGLEPLNTLPPSLRGPRLFQRMKSFFKERKKRRDEEDKRRAEESRKEHWNRLSPAQREEFSKTCNAALMKQIGVSLGPPDGTWVNGALPVLFLLDEFGTIGKLSEVSKAYGLMAGLGMVIWAFVQNFIQLKESYGEEWETFIGNASAIVCFGVMDEFTVQYLSKMLGTTTIRYKTSATSKSTSMRVPEPAGSLWEALDRVVSGEPPQIPSGSNESVNVNEHVVAKPLLSPDEIRRLHRTKCIVIGNEDPAVCSRVAYFNDPIFSSWARPDPKYAKRA